jgi:hypothetical protein
MVSVCVVVCWLCVRKNAGGVMEGGVVEREEHKRGESEEEGESDGGEFFGV